MTSAMSAASSRAMPGQLTNSTSNTAERGYLSENSVTGLFPRVRRPPCNGGIVGSRPRTTSRKFSVTPSHG